MRRFKSMFASKRDKGSDLSSSSSSSHSDHLTPSWKSWIGAKRSSQKPPLVVVHHDIDEDTQSEEEEDEDDGQHNLRIHIQNTLAALPQSNPPFVHDPHQPIFPRSSNNTSILSPRSSTRSSMFHSHLLARLDSAALSPSELSGILPFARKSIPSPIIHPILPSSDISRPKNPSHISSVSLGIQRWITRPCFENRFAVYLPTDSGIQCYPVTSTMAIAALEYPEYLDVMVDPDFDQFSPNPETNVFSSCHHAPPADPLHTPAIQSHASPEPNPTPGIFTSRFCLILDSHPSLKKSPPSTGAIHPVPPPCHHLCVFSILHHRHPSKQTCRLSSQVAQSSAWSASSKMTKMTESHFIWSV